MNATVSGAFAAGALAIIWIVLGFWAFVLVTLAALVGAAVGRILEGRIDVRALADVFRGRRSSS
ncbi:hypothetical protein [Microbacterium sp. A93]|uniref:hypothetical protein n=1 Tax=unclassified Microbacterium TaxID=2609290 RepID=UPI003F424FF5